MVGSASSPVQNDSCEPENWQQGDVILAPEALSFVHWADLGNPLSDTAKAVAADENSGLDVVVSEVSGFVIVTQTCDLVREATKRPYVELAPIVEAANEADYKQICKLAQPRYVAIPALAEKRLVADLDRVMTVERPVLAGLSRVEGLRNDAERRQFARALARKRARAALPDAFVESFRPVADHLKAVLKKKDAEANHLDAIKEIRVKPEPAWDSEKVLITVYLFKVEAEGITYDWAKTAKAWEAMFKPNEQYAELFMQVVRYDQIDALTYLSSDEIDFDNLSPPASS